ncbi:hypothetical protein KUCAC02_029445, partial [Chaenocephalus aceratus]
LMESCSSVQGTKRGRRSPGTPNHPGSRTNSSEITHSSLWQVIPGPVSTSKFQSVVGFLVSNLPRSWVPGGVQSEGRSP